MINLILTMMVAYEEFGNQLNFNKTDIDNIIKKHDIINKLINPEKPEGAIFANKMKCNEIAWIVLYENNYITKEQLAEQFNMVYEDNNFWMVFDGFKDVLDKKDNETEIEILSHDFDYHQYSNGLYGDHHILSYWKDYTEDTLQVIIDTCIKSGVEIDDEEMTEENTKLVNGDIYFNDIILKKIIDDYDDLEDIKRELSYAISEAQEEANNDEVYDEVKKAFIKSFGEFKLIDVDDKEKLYVKIYPDFEEVKNFLKKEYDEFEFEDETYGSLYEILKEMEHFKKFKAPNYDYLSGDIDNELLNEYSQSRLEHEL